ncbi:MAG: ABC transporter substrate-binding protein [Pseudomonadota bacterium]
MPAVMNNPVFPRVFSLVLALSLLAAGHSLAADISPQEIVRNTSSRMLVAMHAEQDLIERDAAHLYDLVEEIVLPYFDFRRMSQWVLGKSWRKATPDQREQFVEQFRMLLVRTYGTALLEYADEEIVYLPYVQENNAARVTVRTEIDQSGIGVIPIYYAMYQSGAGWKVYDISISGVSLVTNYRSTYGSIIRKDGIDHLIDRLAERNRLQAGG